MPKDVGRPPVMKPDVINKLEQAFSLGATDVEACFFAGISHQTLYNYQDKNPEFIERKRALKEKLVLKARSVIATAMEANDKQTAQWYLERKRKDEFSLKIEQETSGTTTVKHEMALTDKEIIDRFITNNLGELKNDDKGNTSNKVD